ncbi:hypothetical protein BU15DRAFT_88924 [Melanogaster broomeanus]|nr:hypothetical protein BU15DRAFT_88924 [Melanogaster broomeanus]
MVWGLSNLWNEGKEGSYPVHHGHQPFVEHIKWALRYHDRQFRTHETFSFVSFGILQCRQIHRKTFKANALILSTITIKTLRKVQAEEDRHVPISDPAIKLLCKHLYATGVHIMGSNQLRYQLRSQIWSTTIMMNPFTLWITINPCNLHDPIAQVFAGEDINMDALFEEVGPSNEQQAKNIASDPYAAAKFFHFMIQIILYTLFGIEVTAYQVKQTTGVFGKTNAYFGTVDKSTCIPSWSGIIRVYQSILNEVDVAWSRPLQSPLK